MSRIPARRSLRVAAVVAAGLLMVGVALLFLGPYRVIGSSTFDPSRLSGAERIQLSELVLNIAEAPQEALPQAREAAWVIFRRHGTLSPSTRRDLETIFLTIGHGIPLFWQDARRAIDERRPVKSAARTQWEAELSGQGWLSLGQQRRYDDFMARIVKQEPIESTHGMDLVVDARIADQIVKSWDENEWRGVVAELLTPPAQEGPRQ